MQEKIATPKRTMEIINKYNFIFQKRFGQNFLIDSNILEKIVHGAELTKEDVVIEIGPGIGSLTQVLAENAKMVIAIEIDKKLIPILEETLIGYDNVIIINEDILKVDMQKLIDQYNDGRKIKVIANLPYYITTPIIMGLFENNVPVDTITVMVQKEVADRMQAGPGTKDYGALSLAVQYYSKPKVIAQVGPNCFIPAPKVGSSVISLKRFDEQEIEVADEKFLFRIIRASFNQRRKTLVNSISNQETLNVSKACLQQVLGKMGLDERIRGEALTLKQFIELSNYILTN
ncbi:MAG: 16S rRNA (adenine(1518)-N(6)/adenine(1519)-N(6))-dimethyltransferase [Firmicutes bacterium HGW-Firmicutes-1]|nr:MAG: 16S rRNA (adenine(1518)-N(6)/adenine(1519)-N(6))-dimethyltransferase [Firmicutes bacterium HGW-Firmicutes-1]